MVYFSAFIVASFAATLSVSGHPLSARQDKPFSLENGKEAQQRNFNFANLTAGDACSVGEDACIDGAVALCDQGKFVTVTCGSLQCFALPLVNKPGTVVTCATEQEAAARIAATGATGGIAVDNNIDLKQGAPNSSTAAVSNSSTVAAPNSSTVAAPNTPTETTPASVSAPSPSASKSPAPPVRKPLSFIPIHGFTLQNGLDAQQENAKSSTLDANSPCDEGETTCVGSDLGQCSGGKFIITQCAPTTRCFVLPLVNKRGTSPSCTTEGDAAARIAATGATGGIQG